MIKSIAGAGCFVHAFILIFFAVAGNWLVGYNMEVWFGYQDWAEINLLLRLVIGAISFSAALPLGIIGFLLGLVFGVPILL